MKRICRSISNDFFLRRKKEKKAVACKAAKDENTTLPPSEVHVLYTTCFCSQSLMWYSRAMY